MPQPAKVLPGVLTLTFKSCTHGFLPLHRLHAVVTF